MAVNYFVFFYIYVFQKFGHEFDMKLFNKKAIG